MGNNLSRHLLCCAHSCPTHLVTPWTVACHASLSMEFSRQEYWTGLPCPTPGDVPDPGIKPVSLASPALAVDSLPLHHLGSPFQTFGLLKLVINLGSNFGSNSECKLFFFFQIIYLFIFGYSGSSLLHSDFLQLHGAVASLVAGHRLQVHRLQQLWLVGFRAWAQQSWLMSLVAPRYVEYSQTRDQTCVSWFGRQILIHCSTREVQKVSNILYLFFQNISII